MAWGLVSGDCLLLCIWNFTLTLCFVWLHLIFFWNEGMVMFIYFYNSIVITIGDAADVKFFKREHAISHIYNLLSVRSQYQLY